ncbi:MAG: DUF3634 family protein [Sandaracinus sp.]|nr:DUF3634 family protein [Myxococcales bacterium]MCB9604373.1 DUF3634 family protein [Sandaracinus sp.]MCB9634782.1 DUF3634 family protein [Sandaracinus sp.]MCB9637023.1 DUF3634 family protein [Sandaracinus sp.]
MPLLMLAVALLVFGVGYLVVSRANELFCVSIRDGVCLVIRGNVPPKLWRELVTTAQVNRIDRGTIRAVKEGGAARLVTDGIAPEITQRLRNSIGSAGLNAMRLGSASGSNGARNLGQILGIAWLAWMLQRP